MSSFLPDAVRQGLEAARQAARRRSNRLCLHEGDRVHRVLRLWDGGVALPASDAPPIRGWVALYDGPRHLATCLIVGVPAEDGEERVYEFKSQTPVTDRAPLDFERAEPAPAALIPPSL